MTRRGATALSGVLPIDKPAGMTSHDVVGIVRRETGEGRVGHAGTLDPGATGLLVVLLGPCTRLGTYLSGASKRYRATIAFGSETDTDDAEGRVTRTALAPELLFDPETARESLGRLLGDSLQLPPAYSAIKVDGKVAHREARAGRPIDLSPRQITVHEVDLLATDATACTWDVTLRVSKGTYVRALARDLGRACGSAAHLRALRRTGSGRLTLKDAHSLEDVREAAAQGRITSLFADEVAARGLPQVHESADAVADGAALARPSGLKVEEGAAVAVMAGERLAGVYRVHECSLVPEVVLPARGDA